MVLDAREDSLVHPSAESEPPTARLAFGAARFGHSAPTGVEAGPAEAGGAAADPQARQPGPPRPILTIYSASARPTTAAADDLWAERQHGDGCRCRRCRSARTIAVPSRAPLLGPSARAARPTTAAAAARRRPSLGATALSGRPTAPHGRLSTTALATAASFGSGRHGTLQSPGRLAAVVYPRPGSGDGATPHVRDAQLVGGARPSRLSTGRRRCRPLQLAPPSGAAL